MEIVKHSDTHITIYSGEESTVEVHIVDGKLVFALDEPCYIGNDGPWDQSYDQTEHISEPVLNVIRSIVRGETLNDNHITPSLTLEVGDRIDAIRDCVMLEGKDKGKTAITPGKSYKIVEIYDDGVVIIDNQGDRHSFDQPYLSEYFYIPTLDEQIARINEILSK